MNPGGDYRSLAQLRSAEQQFDLQWAVVSGGSPLAEKTIGEADIRRKTGASVVGVIRGGRLEPNPEARFRLCGGDLVAIIGNDHQRQEFGTLAAASPTADSREQADTGIG